MNNFSKDATETTPAILCDFEKEILTIKGRSIPENANRFYAPITSWLEEFSNSGKQNIKLILFLDYINSVSYKMIFEILMIAEKISLSGKNVSVLWQYEEYDDEILEEGNHFASKLAIKFSFEEIPDKD